MLGSWRMLALDASWPVTLGEKTGAVYAQCPLHFNVTFHSLPRPIRENVTLKLFTFLNVKLFWRLVAGVLGELRILRQSELVWFCIFPAFLILNVSRIKKYTIIFPFRITRVLRCWLMCFKYFVVLIAPLQCVCFWVSWLVNEFRKISQMFKLLYLKIFPKQ